MPKSAVNFEAKLPRVEESLRQIALAVTKHHRATDAKSYVVAGVGVDGYADEAVWEVARQLRDSMDLRPMVIDIRSQVPGKAFGAKGADLIELVEGGSLDSVCFPGKYDIPSITHTRDGKAGNNAGQFRASLKRALELADTDIILIHTAPVLASTDPLLVGEFAPRMLLTVPSGEVRFEVLQRAKRELELNEIELVGSILAAPRRIIPEWFYRLFLR